MMAADRKTLALILGALALLAPPRRVLSPG